MTDKQKFFADEYLTDLNATRAYLKIYKNCKTDGAAAACASKLLRNAKVKKYIEERLEEVRSEKVADIQEVMEYLTSVMRGERKEEALVWAGDGKQEITEISVSEKDKLKAAELLGKRHGMFTEKIDMGGVAKVVFLGENELK